MPQPSIEPHRLHQEAVVADAHNDLLCCVAGRPVDRWVPYFVERWLPQLVAGAVNLQILPVFIDVMFRPEGALRQTLRMIECAHQISEAVSAVDLCRTGSDLDAALSSDKIALVLALESAPGVDEDIELLGTLHRLGVRIASLAHFGRTPLADGSGEDATGSRLTSRGVAALQLMESIGMLFDVSHLGVGGVDHVLELTRRPVLATHSSSRALLDHHRNLTDDQVRGVAGTGGIICVNFFGPFLANSNATIDTLVDHIEHMVAVAGIDHVGLGPDFVKEVLDDTLPPCCEGLPGAADAGITQFNYVPGLEGPTGLPLVTEALVRRGWSEPHIRAVLGENLLRLLRAELDRRPCAGRP